MTFALSAASISRHGCSPMIVPRAILLTLTARLPPGVKYGPLDDRDLADTLFQIESAPNFRPKRDSFSAWSRTMDSTRVSSPSFVKF
jgi:hypothetical protein